MGAGGVVGEATERGSVGGGLRREGDDWVGRQHTGGGDGRDRVGRGGGSGEATRREGVWGKLHGGQVGGVSYTEGGRRRGNLHGGGADVVNCTEGGLSAEATKMAGRVTYTDGGQGAW